MASVEEHTAEVLAAGKRLHRSENHRGFNFTANAYRFQLQLLHCWPGLGGKRPPDLLRVSRQFPDTARKRRSSMPPSSHVDGGLTDDYDLVVSDGWELEVEPPVP